MRTVVASCCTRNMSNKSTTPIYLEAKSKSDTTYIFNGLKHQATPETRQTQENNSAGKLCWFKMSNEWYYITTKNKKDEQIRSLRRDLVFPDDDRFTILDDVPIILENDEEDDFDEEEN